jgi:hypothetical protein
MAGDREEVLGGGDSEEELGGGAGRGGRADDEEAPACIGWRPSAASRRLACSGGWR